MPFINFPAREINCKLVYYGPGLGGKTANLQWIYDHTGSNQKGKMVSLATETDRTLFFDFLPLDLGTVALQVPSFGRASVQSAASQPAASQAAAR